MTIRALGDLRAVLPGSVKGRIQPAFHGDVIDTMEALVGGETAAPGTVLGAQPNGARAMMTPEDAGLATEEDYESLLVTVDGLLGLNAQHPNIVKDSGQWTADTTTVLAVGQLGIEHDTGAIKRGDGINVWANLMYSGEGALRIRSSTATTYNITRADVGCLLQFTSNNAITVNFTVANANAIPTGRMVFVVPTGTGKITFTGATGVALLSPDNARTTASRYGTIGLVKMGLDSILLVGVLE